MGFLTPWFLAGLAAVGLPVWLHLLRKYKSTPLPFSSLMFFERRTQNSVKHRRLQYLLLFALRTALLILIVLAFAQPFINTSTSAGLGGTKLVVLAIDNSFSMRQDGLLESARNEAIGVVSRLGPADRAQVVSFAANARLLTQSVQNPAELRAAIQTIGPSDSRSSFGELARVLRTISELARSPLEVHLFSDMQKSSLPPAFADLRLAAGTDLVVHAVMQSARPNWSVDSVIAPHRLYDTSRARIQATIAGSGTEAARRRVSLVLNGGVQETKDVEIPANGRASVEFPLKSARRGANRGEIRIDAADSFAEDDRRLFAVEYADPTPVLFVRDPRDRRSPLYFRAALEAAPDVGFKLEEASADQIAGLALEKFAFVVLSDTGSLPDAFLSALRKYTSEGGAVWIAAGPTAAARRRVPLLDIAVAGSRGQDRNRFETVSQLDAAHPSIRRAGQWEGVKFYQVLQVDSGDTHVIARLASGAPVLLESKLGTGRVLLFTSTFDNISNDFPLHTSFVPFIAQTAQYLGGSGETLQNFLVDSHLMLETARGRDGTAIEVLDPQGKRALSLEAAASTESVPLQERGFYELRRPNGRHETIAVNADPRESNFETIPEETIALWKNTGQGGSQEASGAVAGGKQRRSLWWYALLCALALAIAESAVGNRHLTAGREPA